MSCAAPFNLALVWSAREVAEELPEHCAGLRETGRLSPEASHQSGLGSGETCSNGTVGTTHGPERERETTKTWADRKANLVVKSVG